MLRLYDLNCVTNLKLMHMNRNFKIEIKIESVLRLGEVEIVNLLLVLNIVGLVVI